MAKGNEREKGNSPFGIFWISQKIGHDLNIPVAAAAIRHPLEPVVS
jgi:hypothetical protein